MVALRLACAALHTSTRHRNALTFTYMMQGLPIVLYGTEQQATGYAEDNSNRTPMWTYGFDASSTFFTWIRMLNWCGSLLIWSIQGTWLVRVACTVS